jgi:hypothetical protein
MQSQDKKLVILDIAQLFDQKSFIDTIYTIFEAVGFKGSLLCISDILQKDGIYSAYRKGQLDEQNFCKKVREKLGIEQFPSLNDNFLSDDTIKELVTNANYTIGKNSKIQMFAEFFKENKDYNVLFIDNNDPNTNKKFNNQLLEAVQNLFKSNRILNVNSHMQNSLDKQRMLEKILIGISKGFKAQGKNFDTIISLSASISLKKIEKFFKIQKIFSEKTKFLDRSEIQSNSDNVVKLLYAANNQYLLEKIKQDYKARISEIQTVYARNKELIKYEQHDLKKSVDITEKFISSTINSKTILLMLSEKQLCSSDEKLIKVTQKIYHSVGSRVILLIHQLMINDKKLKSDKRTIFIQDVDFWQNIACNVGVSHDVLSSCLIKNYWNALLSLNVQDKVGIYDFVEFLMKNQQYHILLMTTESFLDEKPIVKFWGPEIIEYQSLINRIHFVISKKTNKDRINAIIGFLQTNLWGLKNQSFDYIISIHPKTTAEKVSRILQFDDKAKHLEYFDMPQGIKHLNNLTNGNNVTLLKLILELDKQITIKLRKIC